MVVWLVAGDVPPALVPVQLLLQPPVLVPSALGPTTTTQAAKCDSTSTSHNLSSGKAVRLRKQAGAHGQGSAHETPTK